MPDCLLHALAACMAIFFIASAHMLHRVLCLCAQDLDADAVLYAGDLEQQYIIPLNSLHSLIEARVPLLEV